MKSNQLLRIVFISLLLQACQQSKQLDEKPVAREYNRADAAVLNTQLGLGYIKKGNMPRAKHKLLVALSQAPNSASVNSAMAYFEEKIGNVSEARKYYLKALDLAPGKGAQLNNYGAFLCRQGQYSQAETYFLKAIKDSQYENTAGAYENAGLCVLPTTNHAKAEDYFVKALKQDSNRKQSLQELIKIELKKSKYSQALIYLQKYPQLTLRDRKLLLTAADVAHKVGKTELEADYRSRLQHLNNLSDQTGVNNEHNNDRE